MGEEYIRTMLASLREDMREGEDCLDPKSLEMKTISHRHPAISVSVSLTCMVLKVSPSFIHLTNKNYELKISIDMVYILQGLSDFRIEEVNFNFQALTLSVSLSYESLNLEGRYEFKGKLVKMIPLSGKGPFCVTTYHPMVRPLSHQQLDF